MIGMAPDQIAHPTDEALALGDQIARLIPIDAFAGRNSARLGVRGCASARIIGSDDDHGWLAMFRHC
jgi:hypothetical protein